MITILTCFKNFEGDDAVRQRNALHSWKSLHPDIEIMLFGNPVGAKAISEEFGLRHYPDVPMFEGRLVQIDAMFDVAQKEGRHDIQAYVNGDMIFGQAFFDALTAIKLKKFMAIGQRWTAPVSGCIDQPYGDSILRLQKDVCGGACLDGSQAIDYFCYRRGTFVYLKPLYLGTIAWDNYMIYHCISNKIPVIDLTNAITAIHQKHDYVYLKGGHSEFYNGEATQHNRKLIGGWTCLFGTLDASHVLVDGEVMPAREHEYVSRREDRMREIHPVLFKILCSWKLRYFVAKHWLWI